MKLTRNRIRCLLCGTVLESVHRHDFRSCDCGTFVDGGLDYCRHGASSLDDIEILCEYEDDDG